MAQNLDFDIGEGCCYYDNDPKNGEIYGCLYTWEAAMKACPPGWRLPTDKEWKELAMRFGGFTQIGKNFGNPEKGYKALVKGGSSGFNGLLGGSFSTGKGEFSDIGISGGYWSSTEIDKSGSKLEGLIVSSYSFDRLHGSLIRYDTHKLHFSYCRCVKVSS